MEQLDDTAIRDGLVGLHWEHQGGELVRTRTYPSFADAIGFVNAVAVLADARDHHPDIAVSYREVTLRLSTHSAGGITAKDLDLAAAVDAADAPES